MPVIEGEWWRICEMPDLGELSAPAPRRQHVVDHGFIRAHDGSWQLWACMRGAAVGRLLYGASQVWLNLRSRPVQNSVSVDAGRGLL